MKIRDFASVLIVLFGLFLIYQGIVLGGIPTFTLLFSLVFSEVDPTVGIGALTIGIPSGVLLAILGCALIIGSDRIGRWVERRSKASADVICFKNVGISEDTVPVLLYTLLGVYLLVTSLPPAIYGLASYLQVVVWSDSVHTQLGTERVPKISESFPTIAYHVAALGLSFFVFMKGKSIHLFVQSVRKIGILPNKPVQETPAKAADPDL